MFHNLELFYESLEEVYSKGNDCTSSTHYQNQGCPTIKRGILNCTFYHMFTRQRIFWKFSSEHMIRATDLNKAKCCIQIGNHLIISWGYFKNLFEWAVLENIKRGTVVKTVQHPPLIKSWVWGEKLWPIQLFPHLRYRGLWTEYQRNIGSKADDYNLRTYGDDTYYGPLRVWKDFAWQKISLVFCTLYTILYIIIY
jgi:hypothetical protein